MRRFAILISICALGMQTGCLTLYSKTDVVRSDESRRPVRFECPEAAEEFHSTCKMQNRVVGGVHVGVPFVTVFSRNRTLSEVALWNDSVSKCDCDQDGTITLAEAKLFSQWK